MSRATFRAHDVRGGPTTFTVTIDRGSETVTVRERFSRRVHTLSLSAAAVLIYNQVARWEAGLGTDMHVPKAKPGRRRR